MKNKTATIISKDNLKSVIVLDQISMIKIVKNRQDFGYSLMVGLTDCERVQIFSFNDTSLKNVENIAKSLMDASGIEFFDYYNELKDEDAYFNKEKITFLRQNYSNSKHSVIVGQAGLMKDQTEEFDKREESSNFLEDLSEFISK